jgi:hypothetical protein
VNQPLSPSHGATGHLDQVVDGHLGLANQFNHREQQLPFLAEKLSQLSAVVVVNYLVVCLLHGYFVSKRLNLSWPDVIPYQPEVTIASSQPSTMIGTTPIPVA